jgi:ABC-type phosphate/phosphonate transport system ATPase subunit
MIGDTKTGKSTVIKVLKEAQSSKESKVECEILNPKALSLGELFGLFNHTT